MFYLYALRTTKCSKQYIGITNNPERRFKTHMGVAKHKWRTLTKCGRAVKRYGPETFRMEILEEHPDRESIMEAEKRWIKRFGLKRLWNENKGGAYASGRKNRKEVRK